MSYQEISLRDVRCRNKHPCEWCNELIPEKTEAKYRVYVNEGDFNRGWMHHECFDAMEKSPDVADGWTPGDMKRGQRMGDEE